MFFLRRVNRFGQINYKGSKWMPKNNSKHLAGRIMVFYQYPNNPNIYLWGTAAFYFHPVEDEIMDMLWDEMCELMGTREGMKNRNIEKWTKVV